MDASNVLAYVVNNVKAVQESVAKGGNPTAADVEHLKGCMRGIGKLELTLNASISLSLNEAASMAATGKEAMTMVSKMKTAALAAALTPATAQAVKAALQDDKMTQEELEIYERGQELGQDVAADAVKHFERNSRFMFCAFTKFGDDLCNISGLIRRRGVSVKRLPVDIAAVAERAAALQKERAAEEAAREVGMTAVLAATQPPPPPLGLMPTLAASRVPAVRPPAVLAVRPPRAPVPVVQPGVERVAQAAANRRTRWRSFEPVMPPEAAAETKVLADADAEPAAVAAAAAAAAAAVATAPELNGDVPDGGDDRNPADDGLVDEEVSDLMEAIRVLFYKLRPLRVFELQDLLEEERNLAPTLKAIKRKSMMLVRQLQDIIENPPLELVAAPTPAGIREPYQPPAGTWAAMAAAVAV